MVGIITATAVYGLIEWSVYVCSQRQMFMAISGIAMSGVDDQAESVRKHREKNVKENPQESVPAPTYDKGEEWVPEYIEQFGVEPSFF